MSLIKWYWVVEKIFEGWALGSIFWSKTALHTCSDKKTFAVSLVHWAPEGKATEALAISIPETQLWNHWKPQGWQKGGTCASFVHFSLIFLHYSLPGCGSLVKPRLWAKALAIRNLRIWVLPLENFPKYRKPSWGRQATTNMTGTLSTWPMYGMICSCCDWVGLGKCLFQRWQC